MAFLHDLRSSSNSLRKYESDSQTTSRWIRPERSLFQVSLPSTDFGIDCLKFGAQATIWKWLK